VAQLHDEIGRIDLRKRIADPAAGFPDDDNVGSACFLDDVSRRKVLGRTPFSIGRAVLHGGTKFSFQVRQPVLDSRPTLTITFSACSPSVK
jgi:hypothetical protein